MEIEVPEIHVTKKSKKFLKIAAIVFAGLVALFLGLCAWVVWGAPSNAKISVSKILPVPIAMVDGHVISKSEFYERLEAVETFGKDQPGYDTKTARQQVLDTLVAEEKLKLLARDKNIMVSDAQKEEQLTYVIQELAGGDKAAFAGMVGEYGMTVEQFKKQVLSVDLLRAELATWFFSQRDLNVEAYKKVDEVSAKLAAGTSFESLATQYSQDPAGQATEGDIGFVEVSKLLPELRRHLDENTGSDLRIIPSRFGIHLVKVEGQDTNGENGQPRIHLKQIFIQASDPGAWFETQTGKFSVHNIVKI